jgi:hypothetical protein
MSTDPDDLIVWVTIDDLAGALGASVLTDPVAGQRAVDAANKAIKHRMQPGQPVAFDGDPLLATAALGCAVDLYRRPKTPAGVFQAGDLYARLPADFFASIDAVIVAAGVDLAGGFG